MGDAEGSARSTATPTARWTGRAARSKRCGTGAQSLAQAMQQGSWQGPGARAARPQRPAARRAAAPIRSAVRCVGGDYGDDVTVKVPGEIDVQRARRILEELRRSATPICAPALELDYIERLLKDF